MVRDIKKEMMELLGGEFLDWYSNLNDEEKQQYKIEFNKLQGNDIPHSDTRRMESEGVYEEKFSEKIPQWTQSHSGASEHGVFFNDEWNSKVEYNFTQSNDFDESHALDMVLNDMVSDFEVIQKIVEESPDSQPNEELKEAADGFENDDESTYIDGVDERPIKKEVDYNDDEFDY